MNACAEGARACHCAYVSIVLGRGRLATTLVPRDPRAIRDPRAPGGQQPTCRKCEGGAPSV
eukprot:413545-Prymnesium_polylepis.1